MILQISYNKAVYGKEEIDSVVYSLKKSIQLVQITKELKRLHESTEKFLKEIGL